MNLGGSRSTNGTGRQKGGEDFQAKMGEEKVSWKRVVKKPQKSIVDI